MAAPLILTGTAGDDSLAGGSGNDTLSGGAGNDTLIGSSGNDSLDGGTGNDILDGGTGNDTVLGGDGNDVVKLSAGNDLLGGGIGLDTLDGSGLSTASNINLAAGRVAGPGNQAISGFEAVIGSSGADTITGTSGAESLDGGGGNDTIYGGGGNDTIRGGNGADSIVAGSSDTYIFGDAGNDTVLGGAGNDWIDGGSGSDSLIGGEGNDAINGGDGSDTISGGNGSDLIVSSTGGDKITGDANDDRLVYTATISGGTAQTFDGGTGTDTLEVHVTPAQLTVPVQAELIAFQSFAANPLNAGKSFQFVSLGNLQVKNVELLSLAVDQPSNAAPVVNAQATTSSLSVAHNASAAGTIAATDANGDALTYAVQTGPQHGTVAINSSSGNYTYTAADYVGADAFTLQVSDGHGGATTQVVNVTVTNTGPVISAGTDAALTVAHNGTVAGAIAATDAEADALTYAVQSGPQHGTVTFTDANGHYTYAAGDYVGADSFTLSVADGYGGLTTQVVNVTSTNAGPSVVSAGTTASLAVLHNQAVAGAIAALDADADSLSYAVQTGPQHGTVTFTDANGHFTYSAGEYAGVDTFTLSVSDGHGGVATQDFTVGVTGTANLAAATTVNLVTGAGLTAQQAMYTIDVVGSGFNDSITGDARDNVLSGGAGNDTLAGGDGNDTLWGGTGTDNLSGANGNDYLDAGDGNDALNGGAGNDTLIGGNGNDGFYGGGGNDRFSGDAGNDRVFGDGGNDTVFGGLGNDTLTGGTQSGAGDSGFDTFAWTRTDVIGGSGPAGNLDHITDFGSGDKLDFSQLFSGAHPAVVSSVVHVADTAAGTIVSADLGTGFVDVVVLDGVHGVTVDDLVAHQSIVV